MKREPRMWKPADFECRNKPLDEPQRKALLSNKPIGVRYKTLKKSFEDFNLEKLGYKKTFRENYIKWFVYEMLEI